MQQTTNLKFNKIELTDSPPDITVLNPNFDKIDVELYPTIDPSVAPSGNVGFAKALLGGLANRIKAITGKTNWWDSPTKSLEQLNTDKVDKVTGKGLSTNDYANVDKQQVAKISSLESQMGDITKIPQYAVATGGANTYTVALNPAPTAYVDGMGIVVKINVTSTGASTLNVNGLGAKSIKDSLGNPITSGGLKANTPYTLRYESTSSSFIVQGKGGGGNLQPNQALAGFTFTNDNGLQTGVGDANLKSENIVAGKSIFGVAGTVEPLRYAKGSFTLPSSIPANTKTNVSMNLSFTPKVVSITSQYSAVTCKAGQYYYDTNFGYNLAFWVNTPLATVKQGSQYVSYNAGNGLNYYYVTIENVTTAGFTLTFNQEVVSGDSTWEWVAIG